MLDLAAIEEMHDESPNLVHIPAAMDSGSVMSVPGVPYSVDAADGSFFAICSTLCNRALGYGRGDLRNEADGHHQLPRTSVVSRAMRGAVVV